ncbi:phospholipase ABHD3-like [Gigantopelta aegis]|uniref:phospholipase ABHD3-like n=1 Tax=Gigantopelta aegis TaxID=1735272 RepID=UPI001B88D4C4|nr:phospholipase ABHD3-like [Gigantopelta aegis]
MSRLFEFFKTTPTLPVAGALGGIYLAYYLLNVVKKPLIACSDQKFKDFLYKHCPILREKFWPTVWCFDPRLQTILRYVIQAPPKMDAYRSELIKTWDDGEIKLDWQDSVNSPIPSEVRPTVLILPGLTGSSNDAYIKHMAHDAETLGYRSVVFNNRGNGGSKLLTPRTYCAANTEDLAFVVDHIKSNYPEAPVMGVGISLGGMILFNYISSMGPNCKLVAAMCISVSWNVFESTLSLEKPINYFLFNKMLARLLTSAVHRNIHLYEDHYDMNHVLKSATIREFDHRFTHKLFGYDSLEHYYTEASLHKKIHTLKIPVLCLSAADDPFAPYHSIPLKDVDENGNIAIIVTSHGGHIGFMEGLFPRHKNYMYRLFQQFTAAVFTHRITDAVLGGAADCTDEQTSMPAS